MGLKNWINNTYHRFRNEGTAGVFRSSYFLYNGGWRIFGSRLPLGVNIYDRDWELLVILDGCRIDALEMFETDPDVEFVSDVEGVRSLGSTSREWLAKTFTPDRRTEAEQTIYVTANPYTEEILSTESENLSPFNPGNWDTLTTDDFLSIDEVWRDRWDDQLGTVPPRVVTDRAIAASQEYSPDRLIVHYMQPHQPFIGDEARANGQSWVEGNCWNGLRRGDASVSDVREAYRENLEVVLDDVTLLLENIDADPAVISADHGNAFGEWGIYGHPNGFLHPSVKMVPWLVTTASDRETYTPDTAESESADVDQTTEDRLRDLGYL